MVQEDPLHRWRPRDALSNSLSLYIYIYIYVYIYIYIYICFFQRELRGSRGMGVVSSNSFDRALLSVLYMLKPSCRPMFNQTPFLGTSLVPQFPFNIISYDMIFIYIIAQYIIKGEVLQGRLPGGLLDASRPPPRSPSGGRNTNELYIDDSNDHSDVTITVSVILFIIIITTTTTTITALWRSRSPRRGSARGRRRPNSVDARM